MFLRKIKKVAIAAFVAATLFSCSTAPQIRHEPRSSDLIVLDNTMVDQKAWLKEARTRFDDPIVVACHGYTERILLTKPVWMCHVVQLKKNIPVKDLATILRQVYPNRDIVLVICNEDGLNIQMKRVWHAKTKVWQVPDSAVNPMELLFFRSTTPDCTGDIKDFTDE